MDKSQSGPEHDPEFTPLEEKGELAKDLSKGKRVPWSFDLKTIMIFIFVFGAGLGLSLSSETVGLGVPILLFGPAMIIRMGPTLLYRKRNHIALNVTDLLIESFATVFLLVITGIVSFVLVCTPSTFVTAAALNNRPELNVVLTCGITAGMLGMCVALYFVGRKVFPPKD
jgi:hypothetical protein